MWTKEAVDDALKSYLSDKARALHLAIEIDELSRRIDTAVASLEYDETGPAAQVITGMPHGNKVGNPTEEVALRLASGWLPPEVKEWQMELNEKQAEYETLSARIKFVDAWLLALSERESWIVRHQFMQQEYWRDILRDYDKQFGGDVISKDALKFLKARAMKRIYDVARVRE